MTTYAIYEAAGGDREPVVVLGYTDLSGRPLTATMLPHEREQECAYVIVLRNAGIGARHLVESSRLHTGELGSCDVVVRELSAGPVLVCLTCSLRSTPAQSLDEAAQA
jgi:hypothetical protein